MKIEDALKKVCPFIRDYKQVGDVAIDINSSCIGEKCMAWAWDLKRIGPAQNFEIVPSTTDGHCIRCYEK